MTIHDLAATEIAASWAKTLAGLRELSVQLGWVRERLLTLGAARSADVLSVVLAKAQLRDGLYSALLLRVSLALSAESEAEFKRAIAAIAEVRGQHGLARFMGAYCPAQGAAPGPLAVPGLEEEQDRPSISATAQPGSGKGRPLSLGERKSIARKRDRALLLRVIRDPHPDVIRIVLDNPAIAEDDVVRLCAQRPIASTILVQVFQHARWMLHPRVRLTLALNPHTPEAVALQLLPHLAPAELKEIVRSGQISEQVRNACFDAGERTLH